ncbi:MAG: ribose ABC transporter permease [Burkholderia sp.]|nr:ribose ABC transporter permease [Burkholderia sp.]
MAQSEATATPTAGRTSGGAGLSARQVQMQGMIQAVGMLPVLIIICIIFHYMSDYRFFTSQNVPIVLQQASINTVLAAGMTFVILTGGIDLSVGSVLATSAMAASIPLGGGFELPWLAIIALLVIIVSWFILNRTVLGVRIYAVGGNPAAARLSGIKVWAILLFVYCASGLLAGLGGVMIAARLFAANGLQVGQAYELDAIAAVILGGTSFVGGIGSIWGTLIGALIIAVLTNGLVLLGVSDIWQFIIKGLVIIGAVTLDRFRTQGSART